MTSALEYHIRVRYLISASVGLLLFVTLAGIVSGYAQINGAPASVTSPGFGGRSVNGAPSSVTSLGPSGHSSNSQRTYVPRSHLATNGETRHRHLDGEFVPPVFYAVPVPYAVDNNSPDDQADDDSEYQGGPTVFDRRGYGASSYVPPVSDSSASANTFASMNDESAPVPTILIFKDGHKLEVGNYAIVGATLFDLTPGHPRKIELAALDLEATRKQNDDRGVVFQSPPSLQAD